MATAHIGVSPKSYGVAVCLSTIFGVLGFHHFYLGRYLHGLLDVTMTVGGGLLIFLGDETMSLVGIGILIIDGIHTFIITIMLLVGTYRDGQGLTIAYPGQRFE